MNFEKIFGYNIRTYRELRKLSQEALAVKAKLSSNYLGEVERGKETISVRRFLEIAKVLDVEPHYFFLPKKPK